MYRDPEKRYNRPEDDRHEGKEVEHIYSSIKL
jgi:hypothetical protein